MASAKEDREENAIAGVHQEASYDAEEPSLSEGRNVSDSEREMAAIWGKIAEGVEVLIDLTKCGYSKEPGPAADTLLESVIANLKKLREAFVETEEHSKKRMEEFAEKILSDLPQCITTLAPFMTKVYKCLSNGYELQCLIEWAFTVTVWTNCSKAMCKAIIKEGILTQLIVQLIDLPNASSDHQEVLADLIHLSMLALLSLIEDREFHHHFRSCRYSSILISHYLPSKNFSIAKLAKMSLALLHRHLNISQAEKHLKLSKQDVTIVLKILAKEDLTEKEKSEFWHMFSGSGLASMLKCFCRVRTNCDTIIEENGLKILMDVLDSTTDDDSLEAYVLLLWKLSSACRLNHVRSCQLIIDKLQQLSKCHEEMKEELLVLIKCASLAYSNSTPESDDECLILYAEKSFQYDLLEECVELYEKVPKDSVSKDRLALFQGKSLYHIFMQELDHLKSISITSPAYTNARLSCYSKIKQVIQHLGTAYDTGTIDPEGSQMLDTSMMIFLSESRNLSGKLPRCLLCYKKCKLAKSHICPRAILDDFAKASGAPDSGKAYFVSWPWQRMFTGSLKSSGEMTIRVLCHDCESILSKVESKFLPHFFRKFYNIENPQSITEEQCIEYEEWLYEFCVSLVFRGMALQFSGEYTEYRNQDEVHTLLIQCRKVLLNKVEPGSETPNMSIFIAPTKGDPSEIQSSLINVSIHHPFHFFFSHKRYMYGPQQLYLDAYAYVFQIGMIWTTAILPTADWFADEMFTIQRTSGVYKILPDKERRSKIPDELWETILADAVITEKEVMEQPKKAIVFQPLDDLLSVPPVSFMADILNITKESAGMGKGSMLSGHPKIINFIPNEFSVFHPAAKNGFGSLTIPESHRILLHLDSPLEGANSGKGATAFIAVGNSKHPYGIDSPYLIFHQYEPGLQQNTAFFFSPETLEFVDYLPDPFLKRFLGDAATSDLIKKSNEIVSLVLKVRGYRNYHSLHYWMKSKRGPDSLDMKCSNRCWYCQDLCEICLDQAILGPTTMKQGETTLKFCSEQCYKIFSVIPEPHMQTFAPADQDESTQMNVPQGHKEFLRLYSNGKVEDGDRSFTSSLSLCEGNGSDFFPLKQHYVNYYLRTLNYQCHYEYFISEDLQPMSVVKYTKESAVNLFDEDDSEDIVQSSVDLLQGVFARSNLSTISQLFEALKMQDFLLSAQNALFLSNEPTVTTASGLSTSQQTAAQTNDPIQTDDPVNPEDILAIQQMLQAFLGSNNLKEFFNSVNSDDGNVLPVTVTEVDDESSSTTKTGES